MSIKKIRAASSYFIRKRKSFQLIFLLMKKMLTLSFFFFLDVFILQNRIIRLSQGLFRETYSIIEFIFDPHIAYQNFKLTAESQLTMKEVLFILENLKLKKSRTIIYQNLFLFRTRHPNF